MGSTPIKLHLSQITGTILTFDKRIQEAPGVVTFRFRPKPEVEWQAGQYFVYVLPSAWRDSRYPLRPFTVVTSPAEGHLQITTRLPETPSRFKQQLMKLQPGDHVYAAGPYGSFTLESSTTEYVFLAGGIGVTPFRAMLAQAAAQGDMPNITMLYSGRDQNLPFRKEFDGWSRAYPNFHWHLLTEPEHIDAATISKYITNPKAPTYMVSGPRAMVQGVSQTLKAELGIASSQIKHDVLKGYPWPLI